jgi:hypothetical protein
LVSESDLLDQGIWQEGSTLTISCITALEN